VDRLLAALHQRGDRIWIDRDGIVGSQAWRAKIVDALKQARAVLFFGSRDSFVSEHVTTELTLASELRKPIIPVYLDDGTADGAKFFILAGLHRIRLADHGDREAVDAIHRALQGIDEPSSSVPMPARKTRPGRGSIFALGAMALGLSGMAFGVWAGWFRPGASGEQKQHDEKTPIPGEAPGKKINATPFPWVPPDPSSQIKPEVKTVLTPTPAPPPTPTPAPRPTPPVEVKSPVKPTPSPELLSPPKPTPRSKTNPPGGGDPSVPKSTNPPGSANPSG
jgi:hypothetical protein